MAAHYSSCYQLINSEIPQIWHTIHRDSPWYFVANSFGSSLCDAVSRQLITGVLPGNLSANRQRVRAFHGKYMRVSHWGGEFPRECGVAVEFAGEFACHGGRRGREASRGADSRRRLPASWVAHRGIPGPGISGTRPFKIDGRENYRAHK